MRKGREKREMVRIQKKIPVIRWRGGRKREGRPHHPMNLPRRATGCRGV
jgi:hypothetical protein